MKCPGDDILRIMRIRGWLQSDLAWVMGIDSGFISRIIAGQRKISPLVAKRLAAATNTKTTYWLMLQAKHDADRVPKNINTEIKRRLAVMET